MLQTIATGVQQRLEKSKSSLVALFEYLNKMGVQLQLETLLAQAEFLSKTRWKSALVIDSSESSKLRIYYWLAKNLKKRFLEFRMEQETVSEWDMDQGLVSNPVTGLSISHALGLGSFSETNGVLSESLGPSLTMVGFFRMLTSRFLAQWTSKRVSCKSHNQSHNHSSSVCSTLSKHNCAFSHKSLRMRS